MEAKAASLGVNTTWFFMCEFGRGLISAGDSSHLPLKLPSLLP